MTDDFVFLPGKKLIEDDDPDESTISSYQENHSQQFLCQS